MLVGIDPGVSGALAFLSADGTVLHRVQDMPTMLSGTKNRPVVSPELLADALNFPGQLTVVIENVSVRPGEGAVGAFKFGLSCGVVRGVAAALGHRVVLLTPQAWKRAVGIPAGSPKDASRARASALFPAQASVFARKKDEGRAEAALIAYAHALLTAPRV